MDDLSKEIAKDLFKRLPNGGMTEQEFVTYMTSKGSSKTMADDVMSALKSIGFTFKYPFTFEYHVPAAKAELEEEEKEEKEENNYSSNPSDWFFGVLTDDEGKVFVCLSMDPDCLDDDLGSYNLPSEIKKAMEECWIHTVCESEESIWEVYRGHEKETIVKAMVAKGFIHNLDFEE